MSTQSKMINDIQAVTAHKLFAYLEKNTQTQLNAIIEKYRLTYQETRQLIEITRDFEMWGVKDINLPIPTEQGEQRYSKEVKKKFLRQVHEYWQTLKVQPNQYPATTAGNPALVNTVTRDKEKLGLGHCPVASTKTRCCNLLTLDAVENCGYECSYCSIQSFYSGNEVFFDSRFAEKLQKIELDPNQTYHIGTGQSSDSLMWGNSHGILDALIDFAAKNPNVILELKTKSGNINHLLRNAFPKNIICTWSLNTTPIIQNEELGSASLTSRLDAARKIADSGHIIGFHFHPMVHYDNWKTDYRKLFDQIQQSFKPEEVALISFGTLTYIKSVVKQIREKGGNSQILKMPLVEAEGKLSYPDHLKLEMFRHAYSSFSEQWRQNVFFYLCMENHKLWKPVFGYDYVSNEQFEQAMKQSYFSKIQNSNPPG